MENEELRIANTPSSHHPSPVIRHLVTLSPRHLVHSRYALNRRRSSGLRLRRLSTLRLTLYTSPTLANRSGR
jgi:hypothetical protein